MRRVPLSLVLLWLAASGIVGRVPDCLVASVPVPDHDHDVSSVWAYNRSLTQPIIVRAIS